MTLHKTVYHTAQAADLRAADLGGQLRSYRKLKGLSQQELSEALGVTRTAVLQVESNRRKLSAEELIKACRCLDVDPNTFLDYPEQASYDTGYATGFRAGWRSAAAMAAKVIKGLEWN